MAKKKNNRPRNIGKQGSQTKVNQEQDEMLAKKRKNRITTAVVIVILIIFFIVNNTRDEPESGPYPPYYKANELTD